MDSDQMVSDVLVIDKAVELGVCNGGKEVFNTVGGVVLVMLPLMVVVVVVVGSVWWWWWW